MAEASDDGGGGDHYWSFGYGSNMDVEFVETKKQVRVLDHTAAVLPGYALCFDYPGFPLVEPAFANCREEKGAELHGIAFCMTKEGMDRMDEVEAKEYTKKMVTLTAYDGRKLRGFIYKREDPDAEERPPSKRYMGIILNGARNAGLKSDYIAKLERHPTFSPPDWVPGLRSRRPSLSELRPVSLEELSKHDTKEDCWISVLGYVLKPVDPGWFKIFFGREVTGYLLMHHHGINFDDGGQPPYPLVKDLGASDLEYLTQIVDCYSAGSSSDGLTNLGEIVGRHQEFFQQQESGKTEFKHPK